MTAAIAPNFSIVVPCFNEEHAIASTLDTLRSQIPSTTPYEIIVVNDGSTDGTVAALSTLDGKHPNLQIVHHPRNRGYGAALKTGIRHARSELIVITDADGTYPNERIPELVKIAENYDMVVGARVGEDVTYSTLRKVPKIFLRAYSQWLTRSHIPDLNSGLRVFRKEVAERFFNILPEGFSFTTTITLAMLTNQYRVRYEAIGYKSRIGKSKIKPIRDTLRFSQLILRTGMYFAPLRVFMPFVYILAAISVACLSYDIWQEHNIGDKTVIMFMFTMNTFFFALIADMIDKRSTR